MSRLIERLKAEKNDPRTAAEITYDIGQQLESVGNKEVFQQNPDFYKEYLDLKDSLRRPVGGEVWDAFSTAIKDTIPEELYNTGAALVSMAKGAQPGGIAMMNMPDPVTDWLHKKAAEERAEAEIHRGEVSVRGVEDINDVGDFGRWATTSVAENVPGMAATAAAMLTGGGEAALLAKLGRGILPSAVQNIGQIYGNMPEDAKGTPIAGLSAVAGGTAAGAIDVVGLMAGPLRRVLAGAAPIDKTIVQSMMGKIGAEGMYKSIVNVMERGGWKGAAANFASGAAFEGPTELAQEAIAIAAEEFGSGQQIPEDVIRSRLLNAGAGGAVVGGAIGGATGFATKQASHLQKNNEQFNTTVQEPAPPMQFGDLPPPPEVAQAFNVIEPAPPMDFGTTPLTAEEQEALYAVHPSSGPMQFQTDDEIDMESLANQAFHAASGVAKLMAPSPQMESELNIEADSYVAPKKQLSGQLPIIQQSPKLPDKYDITKPLLGEGNEIYAADAPDALSPMRGLEDAARFGVIRTPEEVAADIAAYEGSKISPSEREARKQIISGEAATPVETEQSVIEPKQVQQSQEEELDEETEQEPVIPLAPVIAPTKRIEGGPPLIGRIYSPEDGGNQAKIESAARGAKASPFQTGSRKAVVLLDKATGQILVRDVKPAKAMVEGKRIADIIVGGMQKAARKGKGRVIDPTYATEGASWTKISQEMFRGIPRFDVIGEFAWDEPRSSVNFNFQSIDDFNAHGQLSQAVRNYHTRGAGAPAETQQRISALFPRESEARANREDLERVKDQFKPEEYFELLIAHKHKLTGEELAQAKKILPVRKYASIEARSKAIKVPRKKKITGEGATVDFTRTAPLEEAGLESTFDEGAADPAEAAELADVVPGPTGMLESGKPLEVQEPFRKDLQKLTLLLKRGATDREVLTEAEKMASKWMTAMGYASGNEAAERGKVFAEQLVRQLKTKGSSIQFSQRSATSWLIDRSQSHAQFLKFLNAMQSAGANVVAIQQDIDSAYEAMAKNHAFILDNPERGRPIVGLVANWMMDNKADTQTALNAAHEAAHLFIDKSGMLTPEQKMVFQASIHEMHGMYQNYLVGPFTTDLRILANTPAEFLNDAQKQVMERATLQEIQEARSISPDELVTERMVEHLALFGVEAKDSRGLINQIIRFVKDVALRIAMAIQKSLKNGEVNRKVIEKFVENRWLQFINRDFAASNSSLALSLRNWIGAPTTLPERITLYDNLDGDSVNISFDPVTGYEFVAPTASDTTQAVIDRIRAALDRYNAEQGRSTESIALGPVIQEYNALADQLQKKYGDTIDKDTFQPDPADAPLMARLTQLGYAIHALGHRQDDRKRVFKRAIKAGEKIRFSMRRPSESLNPEVEANTQLASINFEEEVFTALQNNPEIRRYLPTGTTTEEFLSNLLQLGPNYNPSAKRTALVTEMSSQVDPLSGMPFNFNPKATIATLPESVEGSSPQQTAIRDTLIKLNGVKNRVLRRLEQARERKAELDERSDNLTTGERNELDKLNSRIPMMERVLVIKDYGLDDQIARLESKIGKSFLWDAAPGSEYFVPPTNDADETAVRGSVAKVPSNLAFETTSKQNFYHNLKKQTEWLSNPKNRELGAIYNQVLVQNRKLLTISAEPIYTAQTWRLRNTYFDSLRNMLRGIGTPISKFLGGRFDKLDSVLLRWSNPRSVLGGKWSRAYDDFKKAAGWKGSDEDFRRIYWNRIVSYAEDVPDGTADPAGAVIKALTGISKLPLTSDAQSKLRILLRLTVENNAQEAEIMRSELLKVEDEKLGEKAQRDLLRQGYITGRRTVSEALDRIHQEMRPVWSSDTDPLFEDLAAKYAKDEEAVRVNATRYFTPTVVNSFVKPFIYHNRQYFKAPQAEGGVVRMANLSNVRDAFERSRGDMVEFARILNDLEGGSRGSEAQMVESTLRVFHNYFQKFTGIANEREKANVAAVETLPRQIMDARQADDLPPEFVNYATYDTGSNRTLLFQLALNSAFGRNGLSTGEFAKNLDALQEELKGLHIQLSNLVINEGKTKEQARKIMGDDKYFIALQSPDHLKLVNRFTEKMSMITKASGSLMADIRIMDELLGLNASMNLQNPRSALVNTLDMLAPLYRTKMSSASFEAIKNSVSTFTKDFFGSLFEAMNIHVFTQTESNARMQELGLHDPELYLSWRDKVADYGPSNALDEPSGVESLGHKIKRKALLFTRRARQIPNLGVADLADLATLRKFGFSPEAMAPGDKNIAPKFRALGIFNMVGQALSNGAVDGQYNNFKDFITRGISFIKNSADPDETANRMLDGKLSITPQDLGYTKNWMIFNDQAAFDYMRTAISEKMDEGSLEQMVADAYLRMKSNPEAQVITDKQFIRIAHLALTEFQLNANFSNAPIDLKTNSLWRLMSPYLTWPYLAMLRVPSMFKDSHGRWKMQAAVDGVAVSVLGVIPLTMAASLMFDWFDENVVGKRSNLREAKLEDAIPGVGLINAPMATLERLGRYGAGGLLTEALNSAINVDDARGGMTADNRILLFSQFKNFKDIVSNLWQEGPGNANYVSVMRPFAQFLGLGGMLQYQQILNKQLDLSNEEAAVNSRINVANYLRAAGRDLDLDVRLMRGPSSLPNEVTPYLQNMELAAYLDDMNMFRESYRRAVVAYHNLHPDEPDAGRQVIRSFQSRHPLKRVFTSMPSDREYRNLLSDLNENGRQAVTTGIRQFNRYLMFLGARPIEARTELAGSVDQLRKRLMSSEAMRQAQALAAQAAYSGQL